MDESEQKASEDTPASDSTVDSKRVTEPVPESEMGNKMSTSSDSTTTTPLDPHEVSGKATSEATETSFQASVKESSKEAPRDAGEEEGKGSSETPEVQSTEAAEGSINSAPSQASEEHSSSGDKTLVGASSETSAPPADGAVGPGGNDVMAKMMEIMAKGSASATPKAPEIPTGPMADMMSKGGGMPDMMAMMSRGGGGMPDMMAMMAKGGMPDMMAMMSGGGSMADMKAMMSKMKGGPMGMAKMFDCIIDMSLSRPDSDSSEDDEDSITIEIPCQYCSRFFTSQMSLKTHILVAHEHEDSSVLNIKKLVIDKGKRGVKDHHGSRRKQSKDYENSAVVEGASTDSHQHVVSSISKVTSSQEDLSAAESSRGVKRGRSERRESGAAETSGASGVEEGNLPGDLDPLHLGSGALPSSSVLPGSPPESRKRSARLRSLRSNSGDTSSQVTTKKSKSGDDKHDSDSGSTQETAPSEGQSTPPSRTATKTRSEQHTTGDPTSQGSAKETSKHKQIKTDSKHPSPIRHTPVTRGKRLSRKDKDAASSDTDVSAEALPPGKTGHGARDRSRKGRQSSSVPTASVPAIGSSAQGSESASASRRSLRSRKSH